MVQYYNDNSFDARTASLMERLHSYFDDASIRAFRPDEQPIPLFKFQSLMLVGEVYEFVRLYAINREEHLSEYFSALTLKQCLENVVAVEKLQEQMGKIRQLFEMYDMRVQIGKIANPTKPLNAPGLGIAGRISDYKRLHEHGIDGFDGQPTIARSLLWGANSNDEVRYKYGRLFSKAKETLDDGDNGSRSLDPEIRAYSKAMQQQELSRRVAMKAVPQKPTEQKANDFDFLQYIVDIHRRAEAAPAETICKELSDALEMLRNVFMTDAEDIYYIRTGDFSKLEGVYDKDLIEHFYNDVPFMKYYEARTIFVNGSQNALGLIDDLEVALDNWRYEKGLTGRKLTKEEYEVFLNERKNNVVKEMKRNDALWKLREHSGGLDTVVTPENFARMFYRRKGVDRYFIELQWELEELTSLIEKNKQNTAEGERTTLQTPQQKAVADFVDKIIILANEVYKKWNNERVIPAVHEPEVLLVIQKDELIKHIQEKQKTNFEELLELCYPENSKSKQIFCQYVIQLKKEGYFGKLPDNLLAKTLASVVGLAPGTVTNYLSQLK